MMIKVRKSLASYKAVCVFLLLLSLSFLSANPAIGTDNPSTREYYDGITGTGQTLKTNLHNLIQNTHTTNFSYDALWTELQYTDEDSTNTDNIIETYTGWSVPKNTNGGGITQWNREHTWSKSHGDFGDGPVAGSDLHHMRPCDATVNSAKGNKDFDNGGNPYTDASPPTGYTGVTGCLTDTDSWQPREVEKGDVARMILYMAIRYEGDDTSYDLEMSDLTPTTGAFYGRLSTLLAWHVSDPPDSWERRRNNRIAERQGNRNPFIDHPEYAALIWAPYTLPVTTQSSTSFTARWSAAINAQYYVLDVSTDENFATFVTGFHNLNVGSCTSYSVTGLNTNTTYYYRLRSYFSVGYSMYSNVTSVQLQGTGIDDPTPAVEMTSITRIYPNPFHAIALIDYNLTKTGNVTLSVINLKGQVIRTLLDGVQTSGSHEQNWNGTDFSGKSCASGIYFIRLQSGNTLSQKKVFLF